MNDYELLKKLLLEDEINAISKLDERLNELLKETQDHDLIIQRLNPIIADLLKETIANSSDEIAKAISPIMGDAIKEQVKTQKQSIVDALYPVVGNMIAKFVSSALKETLEEINAKVQDNLSFTAIKRKITARIKGVDEAELLLREANFGTIETLFLIHTDSGLLIWQGSRNKQDVIEAEMVSSMLSAIRSFVNDWIAQKDEAYELNTIDYGDSKILLEVSGSCYLAVVVKGEVGAKMQEKITAVFSDVVQEHGDALKNFDGDTSGLDLESISQKLQTLFDTKETTSKQTAASKSSKWPLYAIAAILATLFAYLYYTSYTKEKNIALIKEKFYHTPQLNLYRLDVDIKDGKIILSGMVPSKRLKELAQKIVAKEGLGMNIVNDIVLSDVPPLEETIRTESRLLDQIYNRQKDVNISSQLKGSTIFLSGNVPSVEKKNEITENYSKINGVKNVLSTLIVKPPQIREKISFKIRQAQLDETQKNLLRYIVLKYDLINISKQKSGLKLVISAYTDGRGDIKANEKYAYERAENVKNYLIENSVKKEFIITRSYPRPPKDYKPTEDLSEARVVKFQWMYAND